MPYLERVIHPFIYGSMVEKKNYQTFYWSFNLYFTVYFRGWKLNSLMHLSFLTLNVLIPQFFIMIRRAQFSVPVVSEWLLALFQQVPWQHLSSCPLLGLLKIPFSQFLVLTLFLSCCSYFNTARFIKVWMAKQERKWLLEFLTHSM